MHASIRYINYMYLAYERLLYNYVFLFALKCIVYIIICMPFLLVYTKMELYILYIYIVMYMGNVISIVDARSYTVQCTECV